MKHIARTLRTLAVHPHLLILTMLLASISLGTIAVSNTRSTQNKQISPVQIVTTPRPLINSVASSANNTLPNEDLTTVPNFPEGHQQTPGGGTSGSTISSPGNDATPTDPDMPMDLQRPPASVCAVCPNHGVTSDAIQSIGCDACITPPAGSCGVCGGALPSRPTEHLMCPMYCIR